MAQTERQGTKLLGRKFIKEAGNNSEDLHPKTEPQEQSRPSSYNI
jgi:hypothetical protein